MKLERISILLQPYIRSIIASHPLVLKILAVGILISTLPVGWDGQSVTFFKLQSGNSQEALLSLLHELFSWFWLFAALPYIFSGLLSPLGDSSLVCQTLWLRLTPCLSHEIAIARAIWVISWSIWLGILGFFWASVTSLFHQLPIAAFLQILLNVEGLMSHSLLSGGLVALLASSFSVNDYFGKRFISNIALFIPMMLVPIYILIRNTQYAVFFPYALPFAKAVATDNDNLVHFLSSAIIGIFFLGLHVVSSFGYSVNKLEFAENERTL
jgi:hypothetical protein